MIGGKSHRRTEQEETTAQKAYSFRVHQSNKANDDEEDEEEEERVIFPDRRKTEAMTARAATSCKITRWKVKKAINLQLIDWC